jgi:uncharacterized protein
MRVEGRADLGGKIASLGNRLIRSTTRKLADQFFEKFAELVGGIPADPNQAAAAPRRQRVFDLY